MVNLDIPYFFLSLFFLREEYGIRVTLVCIHYPKLPYVLSIKKQRVSLQIL